MYAKQFINIPTRCKGNSVEIPAFAGMTEIMKFHWNIYGLLNKKLIKTGLLICFVSHIVILPVSAKPTKKDCYEQFNDITISEIQKIFSNPESWTTYKGQDGYLLFIKKSPNINRMNYLFRLVSQALGDNFKQLEWQQYRGSVEDFYEERTNILDKKGNLKQKYLGMEGYAQYADEYYEGNMHKAFQNVSAVLKKITFKRLGWKQYQGLVENFNKERRRILDYTGVPKKKYIGMVGYAEYATHYHGKNIRKAFQNVSAVLDKTIFQQLGWKAYDGSIEELFKERRQILDTWGELNTNYLEMEGYARYAKKYHKGNMRKAFKNVSAVLDKTVFQQLGWKQYQGLVEDFHRERRQILDEQGDPKQEYPGMKGYAQYAKQYHKSNMEKAFKNVSAVLDKTIFQQLGWQMYYGLVEDFHKERGQILDSQGNLREKYFGIIGYARYATQYHEKNMLKAYRNISAILDKITFKQLGWQNYQGSLYELAKERKRILNEQGSSKQEYLGMEGYADYAIKYHRGDMQKAFQNVSAVLDKIIFQQLGWQMYQGSVKEFFKERTQILDEQGGLKKEFLGMEGYVNYAKQYHRGKMRKTFKNVSAVLDSALFQQLGWQNYKGTVEDFLKERDQILDEQGRLKQNYFGIKGYTNYAKKYHQGNMQKAFTNVSAVLNKAVFKKLAWQQYYGSVEDFLNEREQILDEQAEPKEKYLDMEGYAEYAKQYHENNMQKTFLNVSAVLNKAVFKKLAWQQYYGSVEDFFKEKGQILDSQGHLKQNYLGIEGYANYAENYHQGNMQKAFHNISAVLGGALFQQLGWQNYKGTVEDFLKERDQILDEQGRLKQNYFGIKGYTNYAKKYHQGNMQKAFTNVSAVLDSSVFEQLRWQAYNGSIQSFQSERKQILDNQGKPKQEYLKMEGYAKYATEYYQGNMFKAFTNVSAVLGGIQNLNNLDLNWKQFRGSVSEYYNLLQLFKDHPSTAFKGLDGQRKVAEEVFQGHCQRAYRNVSSLRKVLLGSHEDFSGLHWSASLK